jgi:O-antigen/teichoic acid export membrane protein
LVFSTDSRERGETDWRGRQTLALQTINIVQSDSQPLESVAKPSLRQLLRGSGMLGLGSLVEYASRLLRNIILARLLVPDAFGLVAILMACTAVAEALTEVGLSQSVVQNPRGSSRRYLNTVWWVSAVRGLLLYAVLWFAAPTIAKAFHQDQALLLFRTGFAITLISAVVSPGLHALQKEFAFGKWVALVQGSAIGGVAVAIAVGWSTRSAWALILGILAEALLRTFLSFWVLPFWPSFGVDRGCLKEVLTFSRGMFGLPILMVVLLQTDTFVIGKLMPAAVLGGYYLARDLADMPNKFLSRVISPLLLPTFASLQNDVDRIRSHVRRATEILCMVGIPYVVFCLALGKYCLRAVYGPSTAGMSGAFCLLSVAIFLQIQSTVIMNVFVALGRPQTQRLAALTRTIAMLGLIYPLTVKWGTTGAAVAVLCSSVVSLIVQLVFARRLFGLRLAEFFKPWWTGLRISALLIAFGVFVHLTEARTSVALPLGVIGCLLAWAFGLLRHPSFLRVRSILLSKWAVVR